jgi:hypothetical protein
MNEFIFPQMLPRMTNADALEPLTRSQAIIKVRALKRRYMKYAVADFMMTPR